MAFILDVNLRIKEILGLAKIEAALAKMKGTVRAGIVGGAAGGAAGGASGMAAASKAQAAAMAASTVATTKSTVAMNKLSSAQKKGRTNIDKTSASTKKAGKSADSFGKSVAIAGKRYGAFLAATIIPFAALGGIAKATALVIEFDTSILKLRQIMGQTAEQVVGLRDGILNLATSTGTSASEIGRVGKVLAQAGFRGDRLTESLTALSKVPLTPSFETIDAALEGTIAAMNQFNKEALTTTEILDVITAVSNKYAASAEDIAKGTARGGAAFEAIGGTFQEFVSVFATVRQSTRESAETVGTFMKTISSRLADPKIVNFLSGKGINIAEAIEAGDPVAALKQIGKAMENITSVQERMEINIRLGGRRQVSRLLALNSNLDTLNGALATAADSAGAFGEIAAEGLKGLQAQLNIMGQEFNKLIQTLAEPMFVPIIKGVTSVGKAFVSVLDVIKPIIPWFVTIVGFAGGFKLLALSIGAATKALAYMSTVGIGGGIPGLLAATTGGAAGGVAGNTARERIQRRLAGGVGAVGAGGAAVAGGVAGRAIGGAGALAKSPLGQLGIAAGLIYAADKLSKHFKETGEASSMLAADFSKAALILLAGASLFSGKGIGGVITGMIKFLGPGGAAVAAAVAALGTLAYAADKAAQMDIQKVLDEIGKKISEIEFDPKTEDVSKPIGELGTNVFQSLDEAARKYEDDFTDVFASLGRRAKNLFTGKGNVTITDAEAREIITTMVGKNPELLNAIFKSAVEQFDIGDLETGLEQILTQELGGTATAMAAVRQSMITSAGGLKDIAKSIQEARVKDEINKLADSMVKARQDFATLHVPTQLTNELTLLSDAVAKAVRVIDTNISTFDKLSQIRGRGVKIPKPGAEWDIKAVEKIFKEGGMGEFMDMDLLPHLEGFATEMSQISGGMDDFMKSLISSRAKADSLKTLLTAPQADPLDILDEFVTNFIDEFPEKISPEAEAALRAGAISLANNLGDMAVYNTTDAFTEAFESVLVNQKPFYEKTLELSKTYLDAQARLYNKQLEALEFEITGDVETAQLGDTIVKLLQKHLSAAKFDFESIQAQDNLTPRERTMEDSTGGIAGFGSEVVKIAKDAKLAKQILNEYSIASSKSAELLRQVEEQQNLTGKASGDLRDKYREAAEETAHLKAALELFLNLIRVSPKVLAEQIKQQKETRVVRHKTVGGVRIVNQGFELADKAAAKMAENLAKSNEKMTEFIIRQSSLIETQTAIDISEIFTTPAKIWADSLTTSTDAVKAFTVALTSADLRRGLGVLQPQVTPEGRVFGKRKPVSEAMGTDQQRAIEKQNLQAALFGSNLENVVEILKQVGVQMAKSETVGFSVTEERARLEKVSGFANFEGSLDNLAKMIQESGLDLDKFARFAAERSQEQAAVPGVKEIEHIGALERTTGDLATSIKTLIERPDVAGRPTQIIDQLPSALIDVLRDYAPVSGRTLDTDIIPRVFEDVSSKLQSVVDMQREVINRQQLLPGITLDEGKGVQDATLITTEAIGALGEKIDAVGQAIESQTKQIEPSTDKQKEAPQIDGLEQNTDALNESNEVSSKTQEGMSGLGEKIEKVAVAMEEGIGIDVETMSTIDVNVQGMSEAAQELKPEFEAVARKVAKEEIRIVLQQLARKSGNSEAASTFDSVVT